MAYWDGSDNTGKKVASGVYTINIDFGGNNAELEVTMRCGEPELSDVRLVKDSVDIDENEVVKLYYDISKNSQGTVAILDSDGNEVRRLYDMTYHQAGYYYLEWNLKKENGQYVDAGIYTIKLEFVSQGYSVQSELKVDVSGGFRLFNLRADEESFKLNADDEGKIYYAIDKDCYGSIEIYSIDGTKIGEIYNDVKHTLGYYMAFWNMKDSNGQYVKPGEYIIELSFSDGNITKKEQMNVTVK